MRRAEEVLLPDPAAVCGAVIAATDSVPPALPEDPFDDMIDVSTTADLPGGAHDPVHLCAAVIQAATEYSIVGTDRRGVITIFNRGAERMLGYRARDLVGTATPLVLHDAAEVAARAAELGVPPGMPVFTTLAVREEPETGEWTYIRKDGTRIVVSLTVTAMRTRTGELAGYIGIAQDITERKRLHEADQRAREEGERLKDEFIANVSHDLRTPVAAIKASIGVVLANEPENIPEPLHRMLTNIDLAADRLTAMVGDLLELTRLQAGRVALEPERYDLRGLALRAARAVEPLLQERRQRIELALPREPVCALVDAERLERALQNLLSNAHKYSPAGTTVRLSLDRRSNGLVFGVADEGPGVPAAERERIFERFYRGGTLTGAASGAAFVPPPSVSPPGSGLGLAIARAMVELHRGRIWVESGPGGGAIFRIALPLSIACECADASRLGRRHRGRQGNGAFAPCRIK